MNRRWREIQNGPTCGPPQKGVTNPRPSPRPQVLVRTIRIPSAAHPFNANCGTVRIEAVSVPTPPTRLLLARHGGTTSSDAGLFAGSSDVELSDLGRAQAARLAQRLA